MLLVDKISLCLKFIYSCFIWDGICYKACSMCFWALKPSIWSRCLDVCYCGWHNKACWWVHCAQISMINGSISWWPLELVALETLQELHVQWRGTMGFGCPVRVDEANLWHLRSNRHKGAQPLNTLWLG